MAKLCFKSNVIQEEERKMKKVSKLKQRIEQSPWRPETENKYNTYCM
jgi:hypothetical protein